MTRATAGSPFICTTRVMPARGTLPKDKMCARIARDQFGLVNHAQARAAGISESGIERRLRAGRWLPEWPTVYAVNGAPDSGHRQAMGAYLWAGEGSAISHGPAAVLHGLRGFQLVPPELSTTRRVDGRGLPVRVHRVDDRLLSEIVYVGPIAVTSMRRTVLDLVAARHRRTEAALDEALRRGLTSLGDLWLLLDDVRMCRRRGTRALRLLLSERTPDAAPTQSEMEDLAFRHLRLAHLPRPATQFRVSLSFGDVHLDLAYPEALLGIELDSFAWHSDREAFERDRERDLELSRLGWLILRITWVKLRWQPEYFTDLVRFHLEARSSTSVG